MDADEAARSIAARCATVNVILTGRDAPAPVVEVADTVTEMRKVKHAHDTGIHAIRGLDL